MVIVVTSLAVKAVNRTLGFDKPLGVDKLPNVPKPVSNNKFAA